MHACHFVVGLAGNSGGARVGLEQVCSYSQPQKHARLGGGGAFPSVGLPVFSEHLPWARLQLLASRVERNEEGLLGTPEGLGGQRRLPHEEQPVQRAWGQEEHSGESLAGLELGDWRAGWDAAAGCGGG